MANYLDRITYEAAIDDTIEDFMLEVQYQQQLLNILYNFEDFIIMKMDYLNTDILDIDKVKSCILHVFHTANGIADIRQTAYLVCLCIDNIEPYWIDILKMMNKLFEKYDKA